MIFIDSNIPMYLVGAEHPLKGAARRLLEAGIGRGERLVTDAEVLQEILHRYWAIQRLEASSESSHPVACQSAPGSAPGGPMLPPTL